MRKPASAFVVLVALTLSACSNSAEDTPYLTITGGSFVFNYRLADVFAGVLFIANRALPDGSTVEVSFQNPAGGPPLVQSEKVPPGEMQFSFTFDALTGIKAKTDYIATIRLIGADGAELEKIEKVYRSDIDQAAVMPKKPLTVGPGYARPTTQ